MVRHNERKNYTASYNNRYTLCTALWSVSVRRRVRILNTRRGKEIFFLPRRIINSHLRCNGLLTSCEVSEIRPGGTKEQD